MFRLSKRRRSNRDCPLKEIPNWLVNEGRTAVWGQPGEWESWKNHEQKADQSILYKERPVGDIVTMSSRCRRRKTVSQEDSPSPIKRHWRQCRRNWHRQPFMTNPSVESVSTKNVVGSCDRRFFRLKGLQMLSHLLAKNACHAMHHGAWQGEWLKTRSACKTSASMDKQHKVQHDPSRMSQPSSSGSSWLSRIQRTWKDFDLTYPPVNCCSKTHLVGLHTFYSSTWVFICDFVLRRMKATFFSQGLANPLRNANMGWESDTCRTQ